MTKTPKTIPWIENERTRYSNQPYQTLFEYEPANPLYNWVDYVLWDCSTEFMISNGMPTHADVQCWVEWLQTRPDAESQLIQRAINTCNEYIKPTPVSA